jgi:hypothetical protein
MTSGEPSDISEARELLCSFERGEDHSERVRQFEDALDLLDSYLPDQDKSQAGRLAMNLRRTYTRKLLEQLPSLQTLDLSDWVSYSVLLLIKVNKEADAICSEEKALKKSFDEFITIWADEAINRIQKHRART